MSAEKSIHIDYFCWEEDCGGGGRWSVLVDAKTRAPLDEYDTDCPSCGVEGSPSSPLGDGETR